MTYPHAMALLSFPVCFTKNVINLVQLWKASKILVGVDLATRAKARAEKQQLQQQLQQQQQQPQQSQQQQQQQQQQPQQK
jgi:hypothetical protein